MSSSVSSERAFSQGGITISKCCSALKGDIVEALQCVKCAIHNDLLFRDFGPSSNSEVELSEEEDKLVDNGQEMGEDDDVEVNAKGWDEFLIESDDEMETTTDSEF